MTLLAPQHHVAKVLPAEGREILRRAIREHQKSPDFERAKAIDAAIQKVKQLYPECFQKE